MEENGRLVTFIFRGEEIITEETAEGMIRYIRTHELLASDAESARNYYHYASDEMGSITHVTAGEEILNRYEYDAWGVPEVCKEQTENRFLYNGQQYDAVTGQYYLRARFYNPVIGRFTQEDTYRGDGLNLYTYCQNNPVYYVDPSGHICENRANEIMNKLGRGDVLSHSENKKLAAYLRNKERRSGLTDAESSVLSQVDRKRKDGGKSGKTTVIYGSDDIANYQYNMIENPGPLAEMPNQPAKNFYGGRYNVEVLTEDRIYYRGGNSDKALGQWFTTEPPESVAKVRIDTAVKPQWIDPITGELTGESVIDTVYAIKIPKGTTVYIGPVGSQGGAYCGGYNIMQTFIKEPWKLDYDS